jgi:hypothetical protein
MIGSSTLARASHDRDSMFIEAPPAQLTAKRHTLTGQHLAQVLATAPIERAKR